MTVLLINYQACPCPVLNLAFFKNVRSTRSSYWLLSKRMSSSFQHTPPSHSSHSERPKHPCWQLFHWRVQRGRHARDHNRPRSWPGRLCDAGPRNAPPSPPAATAAEAPGHRPTPGLRRLAGVAAVWPGSAGASSLLARTFKSLLA